ncbi:MAG: M20/M25/M40 family metallo-hydrolase [Deltaproteobacteria bacterium]|nr:M20/M25/M40 family metallo-hydrolase [Deltaproteobacteria bacterium]
MDKAKTQPLIHDVWQSSILPALRDYIRIPNQSPIFDPAWEVHGHMDRAITLARDWVVSRKLRGATVDILRLPGRTPVLMIDVAGTRGGNVMMYGHLDKQPPFDGWREGLGPWTPVDRDGRLYGRGAADDGYAVFASVAAIEALQQQNIPHPRLCVIIECSEESGSPDLPAHIEAHAARIGIPELVICLDSGCGDYERMWTTTSLRGLVVGDLRVEVLREGVHSGDASGVVPSSFRVIRHLLDRLEDAATGELRPRELHVTIPPGRVAEASVSAQVLGKETFLRFPWAPGMGPVAGDTAELMLNRTWRPALSVTAAAGLPALEAGGNVLRPFSALKLSIRIPPSCDGEAATAAVKRLLEKDPPYGARVSFSSEKCSPGWDAPPTAPWLAEATDSASKAYFGQAPAAMGEGGSIPFMAMLGERFPKTQFLITGVLGPESNAHGPNEFLHVATGEHLTCCVAEVIASLPA